MAMSEDQGKERLRRQRTRSVAIGLGLAALVILFYAATLVRLGPNALKKDGGLGTPTKPAAASVSTKSPGQSDPACKKAGTC